MSDAVCRETEKKIHHIWLTWCREHPSGNCSTAACPLVTCIISSRTRLRSDRLGFSRCRLPLHPAPYILLGPLSRTFGWPRGICSSVDALSDPNCGFQGPLHHRLFLPTWRRHRPTRACPSPPVILPLPPLVSVSPILTRSCPLHPGIVFSSSRPATCAASPTAILPRQSDIKSNNTNTSRDPVPTAMATQTSTNGAMMDASQGGISAGNKQTAISQFRYPPSHRLTTFPQMKSLFTTARSDSGE